MSVSRIACIACLGAVVCLLPCGPAAAGKAGVVIEGVAPQADALYSEAVDLRKLGNLMELRGDLVSAELHYERAVSILEGLAPESLDAASALIDLGRVKMERSQAGAEEDFRRAKKLLDRIGPDSLEMAKALKNLGLTAVYRGDQETADLYLRRALAIEERLDAGGAMVAHTLNALGLQAFERRDHGGAKEYLQRAVSLNEKLGDDLAVAKVLQNLGVILVREGDCATAEIHFQRAFAIRKKLNPESLDVAKSLQSLAFLAEECGDLAKAEAFYQQALALYEKREPGGIFHGMALHELGMLRYRQGRSRSAVELVCRAAAIAEANGESSRREIQDPRYFTDCLLAQAEVGRVEEAFRLLERGRARAFLVQFAERDLLSSSDLPDEIARKRKELAREIESAQEALARLGPAENGAEAERLLGRLRETRDRQRELEAQIRQSSPRFASLHYPESLDLAGGRRALDPGTVLLSYTVGEKQSYLFVVQPPEVQGLGLSAFPLPIGEKALQEAVRSFRNLLQRRDSDRSELNSRASDLYDLLLAPAEARIAPAQRLLISADGPLHTLPFAALRRKDRYLVEWKPLHSVLSATVYAELKSARRTAADPAQTQLVAFGDPLYPLLSKDRESAPAANLDILTAVRRGLSLDPLPATRNEVESIASLFPRARVYLGAEATEERAKAVGPEARILHFASHGLFNERFPLDSALALTLSEHPPEGRDNGLLQAWEIVESMRLDADLVTLSACDTALGKVMGSEGLVGLTRAFQHAGARSVLASLWSVYDVSTSDLMKRFYSHLRAGTAKDEALQAAQIALARSPEFSHPYYWAAFQLVGDWK